MKLGIDVKPGDILVYVPSKPKKLSPLVKTSARSRVDILLVLSQKNYYEAHVLMNDGTVGRFILRKNPNEWTTEPWDWTMSDWERM